MTSEITWHKSSYSPNGSNCVEVAEGPTTHIRDTQNRDLSELTLPAREWNALLSAVHTS
ncbi:DUF397 domain-containing protein [Nocardiopsis sp. LDBS1602]|uniref:DUF397 domain-containing protein n=1 Tax=Nocardiopsis sp. LDBS1602 TaxID=3109597 RepID=UPI002DBDFF19|nr:DUF397 domain-containing protein [Nocardiopsis sp. LDBS1602]MEC3891163.1 DUF397 domain-containing protein [Nocardiopsis sp. LDBS1602]